MVRDGSDVSEQRNGRRRKTLERACWKGQRDGPKVFAVRRKREVPRGSVGGGVGRAPNMRQGEVARRLL